ncbi:dynein light chain LC8-type [Metschnikowia aff. pulcherrima]|uniref:Dynein light chain n=1 Tax=Metschnikowia aff. pulcherrima TaxID=2163413 RepID=A0A4P6XPC1_9ASCO|nr:dynein light chain LC8-type [Metschnikowia aff. pulcherrima]
MSVSIPTGDPTPILKSSDLAEEMQVRVLELAAEALGAYRIERDVATYLKKELDLLYGASWHVVVGKSFGSHVTHEQGYFAYFFIGETAFLVFKS